MSLYRRSIEIILANQSASGAYIASPNFPTYRYSWFRDGSFTAYAMDQVGEYHSSRRFHGWAASVIGERLETVRRTIEKKQRGERLDGADFLHTRYTVEGEEAAEGWPNHQLDGFGTWLWALDQHQRSSGADLPAKCLTAAGAIADYVASLWTDPCYDCWEEFPDQVHTHTLAAIRAGLVSHERMTGVDHGMVVSAIEDFISERARMDGHYVKYAGADVVDASLLGLAVPYDLVAADAPQMRATVERIETTLRRGGGVHRYPSDTFYGGGEWVLLTCWLAWYHLEVDDLAAATSSIEWVEAQADAHGDLPEQVPDSLIAPDHYQAWRESWGEIASPLLWSHAMYLICEAKRRDKVTSAR